MIEYMKVGPYGLEVDSRVLNIFQDRFLNSFMAAATIHSNKIIDVEYVELERDPDAAPAPAAIPITSTYNY